MTGLAYSPCGLAAPVSGLYTWHRTLFGQMSVIHVPPCPQRARWLPTAVTAACLCAGMCCSASLLLYIVLLNISMVNHNLTYCFPVISFSSLDVGHSSKTGENKSFNQE